MRKHVNSINLTKMVDFTASVCSKIARSVLSEHLEIGESSNSHAKNIETESVPEVNAGESDIENSDEACEENIF